MFMYSTPSSYDYLLHTSLMKKIVYYIQNSVADMMF
jgi:hypothetical protein